MISATDLEAEHYIDFSDIGKDRKLTSQWNELMVKGRFSGNIEFANFLLALYRRKLEPPFCMVAKSIQCEISVDECLTGVCTGTDHDSFKPYNETQDGRTPAGSPVVGQLAAELQEGERIIEEDEIDNNSEISDEFKEGDTEMITFVNEAGAMDESFSVQTFEGDCASNSLVGSVQIESQSQVDNELMSRIKCDPNADEHATDGFEPAHTGFEGQLLETIVETKVAANKKSKIKSRGLTFCPLCNRNVNGVNNFAGHLKYAHVENSNHKCGLCTQAFSCASNLKRHLVAAGHHTNSGRERQIIARAPAKRIRARSRAPVKTQTEDQETEPSSPPVKGKKYEQANFWANECDVCHTRATSYRRLKEHFVYSKKCIKETKKFSKFVKHVRKGVFKCSICNKKYSLKISLNRHKLEKHNEDRCSEQESTSEETESLVQIQDDQSPYECLECSQRFSGVQELNLHAQEEHPEGEGGDQVVVEPVMPKCGV